MKNVTAFVNNLVNTIAEATLAPKNAEVIAADAREGTTAWWRKDGQRVSIDYRGARWLHVEDEGGESEDKYVLTSGYRRTWWSNTLPIAPDSILHTVRGDRWERVEPVTESTGFMVRKIGPATYEVAEYRLH